MKDLWFWIVIALITLVCVWLLPSQTWVNGEGCIAGKPAMSIALKTVCK